MLSVREKQSGSMDGGITIFATNGLNILGEPDQDGMPSDDDTLMDVWHNRTFSLAPHRVWVVAPTRSSELAVYEVPVQQ